MKSIFIFLLLSVLLFSHSEELRAQHDIKQIPSDTTIAYFIDAVSTEGTEAITRYVNGKIHESQIEAFGEMGRLIITYTFSDNKIVVNEKYYKYKVYFTEIKSEDDIVLESEQVYCLDMDGNVIGTPVDDRIDIFGKFKEVVPFELEL